MGIIEKIRVLLICKDDEEQNPQKNIIMKKIFVQLSKITVVIYFFGGIIWLMNALTFSHPLLFGLISFASFFIAVDKMEKLFEVQYGKK